MPLYPRIPAISLSLLDDSIWLNEVHSLRIPAIQLCDTQSPYPLIDYPIISNQRSHGFSTLILELFNETGSYALMQERLFFANNYTSISVKHKRIKRKYKKNL